MNRNLKMDLKQEMAKVSVPQDLHNKTVLKIQKERNNMERKAEKVSRRYSVNNGK